MKEYLRKLPKEMLDLISRAGGVAASNNMPVYLVGGFVRDLILGVKNLDLDIVVEGDGIRFAEEFAGCLKAKLIRHRRFGTATILLRQDFKIDISTCRKEFYPQPAHLPVVSRGALKEDLFRRDFTINAMAIDIGCANFGRLVDFFGGKADLDNKLVRVLHDLSFRDDPTRILRAIRFEQRYGFRIEARTLKLLKEAARLGLLEKVQPQRLRDDLILMLKERAPLKEIRRLNKLAGFNFLNRKIVIRQKTYQLLGSAERQINWFKKVCLRHRYIDVWLIYLMALLDGLRINEINKLCRSFAFRKGEEKRILTYKEIKPKFILDLDKRETLPSRIFSMLEPLSYEVIIMLKAKYKGAIFNKHINDFFNDLHFTKIHISGLDLRNLELEPGPSYQKILKKVLEARLNGVVATKEEELLLVKKIARR